MQNIEPSLQPLRENMHPRHWQEWAEYTCVAGSALGTVVAAISGQVAYAALPLTLALSLNLANRARSDRQTGQQTTAAIADVRQVVESIHDSVQEKPHEEAINLNPLHQEISELRNVTQRLEKTVVREDDWETVNVRLMLIQEELAKLSRGLVLDLEFTSEAKAGENETWAPGNLSEIQGAIVQLSTGFAELQTQVEAISARSAPNIEELVQRVATLEHNNKEIIKPYLKRLKHSVKKFEQTEALTALKGTLDNLREELHPEPQQLKQLRSELATVMEEIEHLQQRFEELPPLTELEQIGSLEGSLAQLSEKVETLHSQMQRRLNNLEKVEIARLNKEIDLHSTTIASLQDHYDSLVKIVDRLNEQVENMPPAARIELLGSELVRLSEAIAQMQNKIAGVPSSSQANLGNQIQEIEDAIAQLKQQNHKYVTKQDLLPLVIAIKKLGQRPHH